MNALSTVARVLLRGPILAYRSVLSPVLPGSCRYHPSCSRYALDAIDRYGAARGGWLAVKRVLRCQPFGGFGYDPVPDLGTEAARDDRVPAGHVDGRQQHGC